MIAVPGSTSRNTSTPYVGMESWPALTAFTMRLQVSLPSVMP